MTHRKPRRWTWAPLLLLCAVGAGVTAHAVASPRVSQAQYIPPVHKTLPPAPAAPQKRSQPIVSLVNYSVRSGDTLTGIAKAHCPSSADWQHLAAYNHIADVNMLKISEVITLAC